MEELASWGYIAVAVQHAEQLRELQTLSRLQSKQERATAANIEKQLRRAPPEGKKKLAVDYSSWIPAYRASSVDPVETLAEA